MLMWAELKALASKINLVIKNHAALKEKKNRNNKERGLQRELKEWIANVS